MKTKDKKAVKVGGIVWSVAPGEDAPWRARVTSMNRTHVSLAVMGSGRFTLSMTKGRFEKQFWSSQLAAWRFLAAEAERVLTLARRAIDRLTPMSDHDREMASEMGLTFLAPLLGKKKAVRRAR